jgi:hypothetical protein
MNRPLAVPGRRRWLHALSAIGALLLLALVAAAVLPTAAASREELFEIPPGTWSQRMAGKNVAILPDTIYLTLGTRDVLLLRNADDVPQTFGPVLIMPGQSFRLPFEKSSTYHFACTAHADGQLTIVVDPPLTPGWSTLQWRWRRLQKLIA